MAKISIELESDEWYDIEWGLRLAEISEMNLAKQTEPFLESAQRERAEKVIERNKERAEKYKHLSEEIRKQNQSTGMKRYWEYVKEYQEVTKNAKLSDYVVKPELWIGFKFLDDNGIENLWTPKELDKLEKVIKKYPLSEMELFLNAIDSTIKAVQE